MLSGISTLGDYLRCYGGQLAEKVQQEARPLFSPGEEWDDKLSDLLRQPFPAQGDVIMGLCEALRERNSALVVGEMGSGKTLLALSVPYVLGRNGRSYRTLIMCPGPPGRQMAAGGYGDHSPGQSSNCEEIGGLDEAGKRETKDL
jgi:type I site-specific restriction endonuclease